MNIAQTGLNTLLLGVIIVLALTMIQSRRGKIQRDLLAGGIAAVIALAALLILRLPVLSGTIRWRMGVGQTYLFNLALIALVEELAKYSVVAPWRQPMEGRSVRAASRGLGFAGAEHLLFLLIPTGLFVRRLLLATTLHVGTALLYSRPILTRTNQRTIAGKHDRGGNIAGPRHTTASRHLLVNGFNPHDSTAHSTHAPVIGPAPVRDLLLITTGTMIHLFYNLALQGLDGLIVF